MENFVANIKTAKKDESDHNFSKLLPLKKDGVLRDSFILLSSENTGTKNLKVGYTIVYPGARTGGHAHGDVEEVYHIIKGNGRMFVAESEFDIQAGDTFWVKPGDFHTTFNTGVEPLEYLWVLSICNR